MEKNVLVKALRLQKCFDTLHSKKASNEEKLQVAKKFESVWGDWMAGHFIWKYSDAESLIFAFDSKNLQLFIEKF